MARLITPLDMRAGILTHCREHQLAQTRAYAPEDEPALRAAFARTWLAREHPFEQAMAVPAYAIGIRNIAHALRNTAGELFTAPPATGPEQ